MVDLGLFLGPNFTEYRAIKGVWHGGNYQGYRAEIDYFPDLDFGFVWLATCRAAGCEADPWTTPLVALETLTTLPAISPGPDLTIDPAQFDHYVGEYNDPFTFGNISVTRAGDDLMPDPHHPPELHRDARRVDTESISVRLTPWRGGSARSGAVPEPRQPRPSTVPRDCWTSSPGRPRLRRDTADSAHLQHNPRRYLQAFVQADSRLLTHRACCPLRGRMSDVPG